MNILLDILDAAFWKFIADNRDADPMRLRLSGMRRSAGFPFDFAVDQIAARRRCAMKLPLCSANQQFLFPTLLLAEQCTSETLADLHARISGNPASVLDITAGLGIDAFAFAASGASVEALDLQHIAVDCGNHNAALLGRNVTFHCADSVEFLKNADSRWDLIFADPARRSAGKRVYALSDCSPDITALMPILRKRAGCLMLKASPMLDITDTLRTFPSVSELYILSVRNECKEVLLLIDLTAESCEPTLHAVDLTATGLSDFSISRAEMHLSAEPVSEEEFRDIANSSGYLLEPNASVMKLHAFGALAIRFPGIRKADPNTHLFLSPQLIKDFPGRQTRIDRVLTKPDMKALSGKHINVVSRNYPLSAPELKKKLKVTDGGENYLYACRACGKPRIILTQPI